MNGIEQRTHTKKTDMLALAIAETQSAVADRLKEVDQALVGLRRRDEESHAAIGRLDTRLSEERTHRLTLAQEQRGYVDNEDRLLRDRLAVLAHQLKMLEEHYVAFRQQHVTVWGRLRWLFRGI